jgi:hypothetical protein
MKQNSQKQTNYTHKVSIYLRSHKVSLGLFLAVYGAFYLSSVILSHWTLADWGKDITGYPPSSINTLLPRSFIDPIFFVTSFPALLIGVAILCVYSVRGINPESVVDKEYIAVLLTAFGFTYLVIGSWPLGRLDVFPWLWQKQIISYGPVFAWVLYILGLVVLMVGGFSLYKHSLIYRQKHLHEELKTG